jgi:hypothetical protein
MQYADSGDKEKFIINDNWENSSRHENSLILCDNEIFLLKESHRTEVQGVIKKVSSIVTNNLFSVYIFFIFYSSTFLIFSSNFHTCLHDVYTQFPKFPLPWNLTNTYEKLTLCHWDPII